MGHVEKEDAVVDVPKVLARSRWGRRKGLFTEPGNESSKIEELIMDISVRVDVDDPSFVSTINDLGDLVNSIEARLPGPVAPLHSEVGLVEKAILFAEGFTVLEV